HAWVKPLQSEKLSSTLLLKTTLQSVSDQIPKCLSKQSPLAGIRRNSTEFSPTSTRFLSLHLLPLIVMGLQKPVSHPILLWAKLILISQNCLCSPTTHAGSFRCRHHRADSLTRVGSIGSNLAVLLSSKSGRFSDSLKAQ
ncbi:unnamed protein product, partial [Brassica rapa]